jgi:hypothetical protein
LSLVLDCVSTEASYKVIAEAFPARSEDEMKLVTLLPLDAWPRKDVNAQTILAYTTFGEAFSKFGMDFPAMLQHFDFGVKFWKIHAELLSKGKVLPHPVKLGKGGLYGIPKG